MAHATQLPTQTASPFRQRYIAESLRNGGIPSLVALAALTDLRPQTGAELSCGLVGENFRVVRPCGVGPHCSRRAGAGCRNMHADAEGRPVCDARPWAAQTAGKLGCPPVMCRLGAACTEQDCCPRLHRCGCPGGACAACARHPGVHSPLFAGAGNSGEFAREYTARVMRAQCPPPLP
jgi:hypothetical protein